MGGVCILMNESSVLAGLAVEVLFMLFVALCNGLKINECEAYWLKNYYLATH